MTRFTLQPIAMTFRSRATAVRRIAATLRTATTTARPGTMAAALLPAVAAALLAAPPATAQTTNEPLGTPIDDSGNTVVVDVVDFASLPDVDGEPARMMRLVDEPTTERLFVNGMRGPIYALSYDGSDVTLYVDIDDPRWGVDVQSSGRERGFQSFAFHPDFGRPDSPGYGKFYTWTDTRNTDPAADFTTEGGNVSHHTVLHEWTADDPTAATYDGDPPRELARFEQPFGNHNAGHLAFNPLAGPRDPDYGMLYIGVADGGSGGDPMNLAQNTRSAFGKVLRIDPMGSTGSNGEYGIPEDNPFVGDDGAAAGTLPEIYALGVRNPQRFGWDPATGAMYLADIGQNTVEEVSPVTPGANLGWNVWEGSFRYAGRGGVDTSDTRGDPAMTYPVVEYAHGDPLLGGRSAATGVVAYRGGEISQLSDRILFGDFPSGEIFHFDADDPPSGGNQGFGRVLLRPDGGGQPTTVLGLIRERNSAQGREPAARTDLRMDQAFDGRIFLLNKHDGMIRVMVPSGG